MKSQINSTKAWHLIDAKNKPLGRLSTGVAKILSGKDKVDYATYLDKGDYVVVINAKEVMLTGKKETQKKYYKHSGYPGGLKSKTVAQVRSQQPEELIRHAVAGMLPKNRLARQMIKKLFIFASSDHSYKDKFKEK